MMQSYLFVPLAFETMGPINAKRQAFLVDLGRLLGHISGNPRETNFLLQRLSVMIQRFNAIAFHGMFVIPDLEKDGPLLMSWAKKVIIT